MQTRFKVQVQDVRDVTYTPYNLDTKTYGPTTKYGENVVMSPVYDPVPGSENHTFWKASPNGTFSAQIDNPAVWGNLKKGQMYYMDLTLAPDSPVE